MIADPETTTKALFNLLLCEAILFLANSGMLPSAER